MENLSKEILIEVKLQADELLKGLPALQTKIDQLSASQKILEQTGGKATEEYQAQAAALRMLEQKYKDAVKYIDNVTSAGTANTNSLTQNKALLQALQQGYEAFGSHAEGSAGKVQELERTIKRQENVMKGTTKAAGDFSKNIIKAGGDIIGAVPGGDQLNGILGSMGESFNSAKSAALEAGEGMAASTAAAVESAGATLALKVAVSALTSWMETLGSVVPKAQQVMAGLKNTAASFFNDLMHGKSLKDMVTNMGKAYDAGAKLEKRIQDLATANMQFEETSAQTDRMIKKQTTLFQNEKLSIAERKKASDEIYKNKQKELNGQKKLIDEEIAIIKEGALKSKTLTDKHRAELMEALKKGDMIALDILEKKNEIEAGTTKKLHDARLKQEKMLEGFDDAQNDRNERQATLKQAADDKAEKQRQEREKREQDYRARKKAADDQAAKERAEAAAAEKAANEERIASEQRMLEETMSDFAKDISTTDEHYRQLILKQQDFINKYNQMTGAQRERNKKAYEAALAAIRELQAENDVVRLQHMVKFNEDMAKKVTDSDNELAKLRIGSMKNDRERETEQLIQTRTEQVKKDEETYATQKGIYDKYSEELITAQVKFLEAKTERARKAAEDELNAAQKNYDGQGRIMANLDSIALAKTEKFEKDQADIKEKYRRKDAASEQDANVAKYANATAFYNDKKLLNAKLAQLDEKHNNDVKDAQAKGEDTTDIDKKYKQEKLKLHSDFLKARFDMEMNAAKAVADAGMKIWENNSKSKFDAQQKQLDKAKTSELSNSSLTSSQKAAIEEKYAKEAGKLKVKQFKEQQKIDATKALMAGLEGGIRLWVSPGFPAAIPMAAMLAGQTALNVATILAQKPPAYAKGGLHYVSNGQGSLLKGPGSGTSDSMNARVSNGESVINARSTAMFGDLLSAINVAGGGRPFFSSTGYAFASGGVAGNAYLPTRNSPARMSMPVMARPVIDYDQLASSMSKVNIAVDVKDVNNQQQILAKAINGSNY